MTAVPDKPKEVRHIVMSVPHSGTRTLVHHVSQRDPSIVPAGKDRVGVWHFNFHPHFVSKFFMYADAEPGTRMAYIPIRNPIDVADSWQRRYGDHWQRPPKEMQQAFGLMLDVIKNHGRHVEIFRIEDLPVLRGHGPRPEGWQGIDRDHERVAVLRDWILSYPEVESFYRALYTAVELWWL